MSADILLIKSGEVYRNIIDNIRVIFGSESIGLLPEFKVKSVTVGALQYFKIEGLTKNGTELFKYALAKEKEAILFREKEDMTKAIKPYLVYGESDLDGLAIEHLIIKTS